MPGPGFVIESRARCYRAKAQVLLVPLNKSIQDPAWYIKVDARNLDRSPQWNMLMRPFTAAEIVSSPTFLDRRTRVTLAYTAQQRVGEGYAQKWVYEDDHPQRDRGDRSVSFIPGRTLVL